MKKQITKNSKTLSKKRLSQKLKSSLKNNPGRKLTTRILSLTTLPEPINNKCIHYLSILSTNI